MDRWPIVGRAEEQRFLSEAIADPDRSGVLVAGQAGVGKTQLVHEVLSTTSVTIVERITASESLRPLPFGALAQLLPSNLHEVDQVDLLTVLGRHLQRRAEGQPIVLAVDDVHLLDGLSAGFIDYVAVRGLATVLLTLRSGSPVPDALGRLCRNGGIPRLELQALSRSEFDEMLEQALDGIIESVSSERMWEATRGNVLFARELVADLLDAGELRQIHGVWRWAGGVGPAPRLQEAIAGRLDGLPEPGRQFLELLSIGEPLALAIAERVTADGVLIEVERRGLIAVEGEDPQASVSVILCSGRSSGPRCQRFSAARSTSSSPRSCGTRRSAHRQISSSWRCSGKGPAKGRIQPSWPRRRRSPIACRTTLWPNGLRWTRSGSDRRSWPSSSSDGPFFASSALSEATELLVPLVGNEPDDNAREHLADGLSLAMGHGLGRVDEALALMAADRMLRRRPHDAGADSVPSGTLHAFVCQYAEAIELGMSAIRAGDDDRVFVRSLTSVASSLVMMGKTDDALSLTEDGTGARLAGARRSFLALQPGPSAAAAPHWHSPVESLRH